MSALQRLMAPVNRRLRLLVGRCMLDAVDDSLQRQNVQVRLLSGESASEIEHFQQAGFTSVPLPGAIGLYMASGGKRTSLAAFLLENKDKRLTGLEPGDSAIYHIAEGHYLVLEKDGVARLKCKRFVIEAQEEVVMDTKLVRATGDIEIAGVSRAKDHDSGGVSGLSHRHKYGNGEQTDKPQGAS